LTIAPTLAYLVVLRAPQEKVVNVRGSTTAVVPGNPEIILDEMEEKIQLQFPIFFNRYLSKPTTVEETAKKPL